MSVDVSVIITAYNVEHYIQRAVDSALHQRNVTIEIIVVDDASSDATWQIIKNIADPRVKSIRLDGNSGPSAARNAGFAIASGTWIAVLDGDDAFEVDRLSRCLSHNEADVVVDNLLVCRENDGSEFIMFPASAFAGLSPLSAASFIKGTLSSGNNYTLGYLKPVFSSAFLKKHSLSYDTALRIGEDYQLLLEALLKGAHCVIEPTAGYRYTARSGSISYRLSLENLTRMIKADEQLLSRYTLTGQAAVEQQNRTKALKREVAYTMLVDAIKQKDWSSARKAVALNPMSLWLMHRPIQVRINRLLSKL